MAAALSQGVQRVCTAMDRDGPVSSSRRDCAIVSVSWRVAFLLPRMHAGSEQAYSGTRAQDDAGGRRDERDAEGAAIHNNPI